MLSGLRDDELDQSGRCPVSSASPWKNCVEASNRRLRATMQSHPDYQYFRMQGETNDLMVYFEIYSRMGLGHRMHEKFNKHIELTADILDEFGDNIRLIISDDYDYPLNVPEPVLEKGSMEEIAERLSWP